jgi:hypothetical protein
VALWLSPWIKDLNVTSEVDQIDLYRGMSIEMQVGMSVRLHVWTPKLCY